MPAWRVALAAPVPELASHDRAADLEAVVLDVLDGSAAADAAQLHFVGQVVRLEGLVRDVQAARPLKRSVPFRVTKLMPTPPVCCEASAPPVVTCISCSMSKS